MHVGDSFRVSAFVPKVGVRFKEAKRRSYDYEIVFKNYVFIKTDLDFDEFSIFINDHIRLVEEGFIKLLSMDSEELIVCILKRNR